jgi:hypothetical protein
MTDPANASIIRTLMDEPDPQFVCIARLYKDTSREGTPHYRGTMIEPGTSTPLSVFIFRNEPRQARKDSSPTLSLCLTAADYARLRAKLPAALAGTPKQAGLPRDPAPHDAEQRQEMEAGDAPVD